MATYENLEIKACDRDKSDARAGLKPARTRAFCRGSVTHSSGFPEDAQWNRMRRLQREARTPAALQMKNHV